MKVLLVKQSSLLDRLKEILAGQRLKSFKIIDFKMAILFRVERGNKKIRTKVLKRG